MELFKSFAKDIRPNIYDNLEENLRLSDIGINKNRNISNKKLKDIEKRIKKDSLNESQILELLKQNGYQVA